VGEKTKISWTDHTFNPWWGCTNVSPGCDHCYAESSSNRWGFKIWGKDSARRFFGEKHWNEPIKWNQKAKEEGIRRKVFCASMCDILEEWQPSPGEEGRLDMERERLFSLVESTPSLDWLLLTKRPQNYLRMLPQPWLDNPRSNVWVMTTVESPEYLWRLDAILRIPAVVRGASWEPGLAYVDFKPYAGIDSLWVIGGGESGAACRPFEVAWARQVRDDCRAIGARFFLKQLGGHPDKRENPQEWPEDLRVQEFPVMS